LFYQRPPRIPACGLHPGYGLFFAGVDLQVQQFRRIAPKNLVFLLGSQ
jgi:hypothetical protein